MRVTVKFHKRDDVTLQAHERITGIILDSDELKSATWPFDNMLTYRTNRSATDVICDWEREGFNIDEFERFMFEAD